MIAFVVLGLFKIKITMKNIKNYALILILSVFNIVVVSCQQESKNNSEIEEKIIEQAILPFRIQKTKKVGF